MYIKAKAGKLAGYHLSDSTHSIDRHRQVCGLYLRALDKGFFCTIGTV